MTILHPVYDWFLNYVINLPAGTSWGLNIKQTLCAFTDIRHTAVNIDPSTPDPWTITARHRGSAGNKQCQFSGTAVNQSLSRGEWNTLRLNPLKYCPKSDKGYFVLYCLLVFGAFTILDLIRTWKFRKCHTRTLVIELSYDLVFILIMLGVPPF